MVSRQETARPLLTPGEVMQLPPGDELVLVSGIPPIRAKKARYFEDPRLTERVLTPPSLTSGGAFLPVIATSFFARKQSLFSLQPPALWFLAGWRLLGQGFRFRRGCRASKP
jgi:type IV secretory pathway TraG/TraD family ATPase VirD4